MRCNLIGTRPIQSLLMRWCRVEPKPGISRQCDVTYPTGKTYDGSSQDEIGNVKV
jgi:hypothetical protein